MRTRKFPALSLLFLLSCPLAACVHSAPAGSAALERAAKSVLAGNRSSHDQALAGFAAYLLESKPDDALKLWRAAASREGDPWAYYGLAEAGRRSLDPRARAEAAVEICKRAPRTPLCAAGARIALGAVGETPDLDREIEKAAAAALAAGADGDAAWLLRRAAASARHDAGDDAGAHALLADAGVVTRARLLGPYSRFHNLDWKIAFPPERGDLGGTGPYGPIAARDFASPEGRYQLWAEPISADIYYWAADVEVASPGRYQVRAIAQTTVAVFVDGERAIERQEVDGWLPEERTAEIRLAPGRHRILAKVVRGSGRGDVLLALSRADGAPAKLTFSPADGRRAPAAGAPALERALTNAYPDAASLAAALAPEVGATLAGFVATRDALNRDSEGARALAAALLDGPRRSAPLLALQAEVWLADDSLPERLAAGRAQRDFEEALKLDPAEASALQRLSVQARSDGRLDPAAELLARAAKAAAPAGWRVRLSEMRLAQARGADSIAEDAAKRALESEPHLCEALALRYELARRAEAPADADAWLGKLDGCPGQPRRRADHLRSRGDLAAARAAFEALARENPMEPGPRTALAQLATAESRFADAAAVYTDLEKQWPFSAGYPKLRADALERAGDAKGARAARERALELDGSDLKLRRALAYQEGGEVLDDARQDGQAMLERYRAEAPAENAAGVYVLDSSAVQAHADGSFTERTHLLAKVTDQRGVATLAEVSLPSGAEVLSLRTLKKDGRVLEPETIGGKDGVSLPGVEVGDFIEYEYLASTTARGAAAPGFAAPRFYFRVADAQVFRSVYEVRAPAGAGLTVDAHSMEAAETARDASGERVRIERANVTPFVREPGAPGVEELIPFVQVGAGAGQDDMAASFGDFLGERARPNFEVARWAREAVGGRTGLEAVKALYARVMAEIKGAEAGPTTRATVTLAQGRGSRLMLLKSALGVVGIPARVVLVKPFTADPTSYRFPATNLYSTPALLVSVAGQEIFLAPGVRFAPFGQLGPGLEAQEALVLPEIGEKPRRAATPPAASDEGKRVALDLALAADGALSGSGVETYQGFDAAYLRAGLERLNEDQRRQAVESAIARTFEGASLQELAIDEPEQSGAPVSIKYRFTAPGFARVVGSTLVLEKSVYASNLSRRYLALNERTTPLLISSPERIELTSTLALPPGLQLAGPPASTKLQAPFGRYEREERFGEGKLQVRESVSIPLARIPPQQYPAFGEFVVAIDEAQNREMAFEPLRSR